MKISWKWRERGGANPRSTYIRDPLAVIPLTPENVEQKRSSAGTIHLRARVPLKGLRKRVADWLGYEYTKTVALDELGSAFYEQVDGQRSLREIAEAMLKASGRGPRELEEHIVLFTRLLMARNMLVLKVTPANRLAETIPEGQL
ncbi:MAG: PqqD family protein [Lentisphaerae bacterium]|nr:PqqD family protein [Lentisphaerota bacterium]